MLTLLGVVFSLAVIYLGIVQILNFLVPDNKTTDKKTIKEEIIETQKIHLWEKNKYIHSGFEVVGESYYQDNIERVSYRKTLLAKLIPDNNNQYDSNAVRIEIDNLTVGHLSRECAIQFRAFLVNNGLNETDITSCFASIIGGHTKAGRKTSYGIVLDF